MLSDVGGGLNVQVKETADNVSYILLGKGKNTVIIQFGYILMTHSTGAQQYTATFPIAFRNRCFGIFYNHLNTRSDAWLSTIQTKRLDTTSVTISELIGTHSSQRSVLYMAIGV